MEIKFVSCPHCKGTGGFMRFEVGSLANFWSDWVLFDDDIFNKFIRLKEKRYCSVCGGRTEVCQTTRDCYISRYKGIAEYLSF